MKIAYIEKKFTQDSYRRIDQANELLCWFINSFFLPWYMKGCEINKCSACYQDIATYWYCPRCDEEVAPCGVTFDELHEDCGEPVELENV